MKSQKYLANYKCECFQETHCNCPRKDVAHELFMTNIYDVAAALAEVMIICGIHQCKVKGAVDIIIHSFLHYDEIRHRVDTVPRKRLRKEDLIHELGRKCLMSRLEAQLTYSIIKRAFKAFYHGTCEGGIRNPIMEAQLIHTQQCFWVHAARRTAQVFASYEGMFFAAQKCYESQIMSVYKHLYDRLQQRAGNPLEIAECACKDCVKRPIPVVEFATKHSNSLLENIQEILQEEITAIASPLQSGPSLPDLCQSMESQYSMEMDSNNKSIDKNEPLEATPKKCKCPPLICNVNLERDAYLLSAECSQGPYICRWVPMNEEDEELERQRQCFELPEEIHECPVDCTDTNTLLCDEDCECDCGASCECAAESSEEFYENETKLEEEEEELNVDTDAPVDMYSSCRIPDAMQNKHKINYENGQTTTPGAEMQHYMLEQETTLREVRPSVKLIDRKRSVEFSLKATMQEEEPINVDAKSRSSKRISKRDLSSAEYLMQTTLPKREISGTSREVIQIIEDFSNII